MHTEHSDLRDEVRTLDTSSSFHFTMAADEHLGGTVRSVCGKAEGLHIKSEPTDVPLEEALDGGLSPCGACISTLGRVYGIDIEVCNICDRISVEDRVPFYNYEFDHGRLEDESVDICMECRQTIVD